jgi:hypothetical protein
MIVGLIMVGIGVVMVIPTFGAIGIIWTLIAAVIAIFHAINIFSSAGIPTTEIVADANQFALQPPSAFDERLRRLQRLKDDGLISDDEFRAKRAEIMGEQW